jgi:hypothetical protein
VKYVVNSYGEKSQDLCLSKTALGREEAGNCGEQSEQFLRELSDAWEVDQGHMVASQVWSCGWGRGSSGPMAPSVSSMGAPVLSG